MGALCKVQKPRRTPRFPVGAFQTLLIGSAEVDVMAGDTPETLAARVLKAEHLLYPRSLAAVARKSGSRVREDVVVDGVTVRLYAPRP